MSDRPYETGYARPPKERRFVKGKSGNPNGRPKGSKNHATLFNEIANKKVLVTEGKRQTTMTQIQVIFQQLCNKAATGDPSARRDFLQYSKTYQVSDLYAEEAPERQERKQQLIDNFLKRHDRMSATTSSEPSIQNPTDPKKEEE